MRQGWVENGRACVTNACTLFSGGDWAQRGSCIMLAEFHRHYAALSAAWPLGTNRENLVSHVIRNKILVQSLFMIHQITNLLLRLCQCDNEHRPFTRGALTISSRFALLLSSPAPSLRLQRLYSLHPSRSSSPFPLCRWCSRWWVFYRDMPSTVYIAQLRHRD